MRIGSREFAVSGRTYVMGILNVTPDSFSDGGRWARLDRALFHAQEMVREGADILDIGGESTRPGHQPVPAQEETARVLPVLEAVKARIDVPLSVDTWKPETAAEALRAGADMINDIWGLRADARMAQVIAGAHVPCCLMHNRREPVYRDYLPEVISDLRESVAIAEAAGISRDRILVDPGIGFGKTYEQNLQLLRQLKALGELGLPVLLGCSRKSVIGLTLNLPPDEREEGTLVTTVRAVESGCMFVRVHEVRANVRAIRMAEAILQSGR